MINPKQCGIAARRLGAKMVADQATEIMASVIGQSGEFDLDAPNAGLVIVARGRAAHWLMERFAGFRSIEIEPVKDGES